MQILGSDWLPQWARWAHLAHLGFPTGPVGKVPPFWPCNKSVIKQL